MENEWVSDGNEKAASLLGVTSRWITHHAQAVASLQQHSDTRRSWTGVKAADDEAGTKKHFITGSHLDSWGVRLRGRWWWIFGQIVMKHFDFFRSSLILLQHKLFVCLSIIFAAVHDDDAARSSSTFHHILLLQPSFLQLYSWNRRHCWRRKRVFLVQSSRLLRPSRPTVSINHLTWPTGPPQGGGELE